MLFYVFCMDLRTNSKCYLTQHKLVCFFMTEVDSIYCAVRNGFLYKTYYVPFLKG
jgi:hypothetical protein